MKHKLYAAILIILFFISIGIKFYNLDSPPFETAHAFRNSQTWSTVEDFYINGINLFKPKINYYGYPGYLMLDFPFFQGISALILKTFGDHIAYARILNIIFSTGICIVLYKLISLLANRKIGIYTVLFYNICPLNIVYHRSVLPDIFIILTSLVSVLFVISIYSKERLKLCDFLMAPAIIITALGKPLYLFPALVFYAFFLFKDGAKKFFKNLIFEKNGRFVLAVFLVATVCLIGWELQASKYGSKTMIEHLGFYPLLGPQFYIENIIRFFSKDMSLISAMFYFFGIYAMIFNWRSSDTRYWLLVGIPFLYIVIFAEMNHAHDYYQLLILPYLGFVASLGLTFFEDLLKEGQKRLFVLTVFSLSTISAILIFLFNGWFHLMPDPLYLRAVAEKKVSPGSYSLLYVDKSLYTMDDFLYNKPTEEMLYHLGFKGLVASHKEDRNSNIVAPPYLLALHQYGRLITYKDIKDVEDGFLKNEDEFEGNLRYIIFYRYKDYPIFLKDYNKKYIEIYRDDKIIIFENTLLNGSGHEGKKAGNPGDFLPAWQGL